MRIIFVHNGEYKYSMNNQDISISLDILPKNTNVISIKLCINMFQHLHAVCHLRNATQKLLLSNNLTTFKVGMYKSKVGT